MKITNLVKQAIAETGSSLPVPALLAFIEVESGNSGFDSRTGKLKIQFEPHVFAQRAQLARDSSTWSTNKIDVQSKEWPAFNSAFALNPKAAMESTSIGLPQIMGYHWKRLGYASVGAMWDDFKVSELQQVKALIKFIETDKRLSSALSRQDWPTVASIYNGKGYLALAIKQGREPYDISMAKAFKKYAT